MVLEITKAVKASYEYLLQLIFDTFSHTRLRTRYFKFQPESVITWVKLLKSLYVTRSFGMNQ